MTGWPAGADVVLGSLFSGYGGLEQGVAAALLKAGARSVRIAWVSDIDPGASRILAHRYPDVPNLGDITKVDWSTVERVHILCGGFPCQDVSCAGHRAGLRPDTRSGLWSQMAYAVSTLRPRLVVAENVRGLLSGPAHSDVEPCRWCLGDDPGQPALRALGAVLGDLADIGYDARWRGLRASDVGAPHSRFRVFVTAGPADTDDIGHAGVDRVPGRRRPGPADGSAVDRDTDSTRPGAVSPGQAEVRWPRADLGGRGGAPTPDACCERHGRREDARSVGRLDSEDESEARQRERPRAVAVDRSSTTAPDPDGAGPVGVGRVDTLGRDADRRDRPDRDGDPGEPAAWGPYGAAVARWAAVLGRPAPAPTVPSPRLPAWKAAIALRRSGLHPMPVGRRGPIPPRPSPVLSPRFVEWMMGLPDGWVTDVPCLSRNDMLRALGNGVVPQQAAAAVLTDYLEGYW